MIVVNNHLIHSFFITNYEYLHKSGGSPDRNVTPSDLDVPILLVAHNGAGFDFPFIGFELKRYGLLGEGERIGKCLSLTKSYKWNNTSVECGWSVSLHILLIKAIHYLVGISISGTSFATCMSVVLAVFQVSLLVLEVIRSIKTKYYSSIRLLNAP